MLSATITNGLINIFTPWQLTKTIVKDIKNPQVANVLW